MKQTLIRTQYIVKALAFFLLCHTALLSQGKHIKKEKVPKNVLSSFEKQFPQATAKEYCKSKENKKTIYEIEFSDSNRTREARFDKQGEFIEVTEGMAMNDVPDAVTKSVMNQHPKGQIKEVEKVTRGDVVEYRVTVHKGKEKKHLILDKLGNLFKRKHNDKDSTKK